jgi:hypothetical protein
MNVDSKINICCEVAYKDTEDECFIEAMKNFRQSYPGKNRILEVIDAASLGANYN